MGRGRWENAAGPAKERRHSGARRPARLGAEEPGEVGGAGEAESRHDLLGHRGAADEGPPLEDEDVEAGAGEVGGGNEAWRDGVEKDVRLAMGCRREPSRGGGGLGPRRCGRRR